MGSFRRVLAIFIGSSCPCPAAAALQERVGGVERLVRLLAELRERRLRQDTNLRRQVGISLMDVSRLRRVCVKSFK